MKTDIITISIARELQGAAREVFCSAVKLMALQLSLLRGEMIAISSARPMHHWKTNIEPGMTDDERDHIADLLDNLVSQDFLPEAHCIELDSVLKLVNEGFVSTSVEYKECSINIYRFDSDFATARVEVFDNNVMDKARRGIARARESNGIKEIVTREYASHILFKATYAAEKKWELRLVGANEHKVVVIDDLAWPVTKKSLEEFIDKAKATSNDLIDLCADIEEGEIKK